MTAGLLVLVAALLAASDDTIVESRVDATRIGEGDSVTLTIEVRGSNPGSVEDPDLSGLADFTIAAGPSVSTSTSMLWSGGQARSSTSKQFSYVLFPRRRGTLTIPTISVRLGSRLRQTNPISIEVVQGRVRQPPPGQHGPPGGTGRGIGPGRRGAAQPAGEILVESSVDKREVWVGEQVLLTYKVYTQLELVEVPAPQQLPSYTGFWVEEIPVDPRATITRVKREGQEFLEFTLMKKALFPTASGELTIEETVFGMPVKVESRDPFDAIFFTPTRTVFRKSAPLRIRVRPLPEAGRPASFSGAVGRFTLSVAADREQASVNDALSLKVMVKGTGNIRTIGDPVLPPLPDYKAYAPRVEEKHEVAGDAVQGSRTWDYVLTPLAPGRQDIPPIRFAWFDPAAGTYREASSETLPVVVQRGTGGGEPARAAAPGARREVTAFGRDVRYLKPVSQLAARRPPYHRSAAFASLLAAPVLLNAGLLFFVRRREQTQANAGILREKRAPAFARRRLREARRLLEAGRSREFHQEVARALTGFLGDSLDISPTGLTHAEIDALLERRGQLPAVRQDLRRCLERCDEARFAPVAPGQPEMDKLLRDAEGVIGRLAGGRP